MLEMVERKPWRFRPRCVTGATFYDRSPVPPCAEWELVPRHGADASATRRRRPHPSWVSKAPSDKHLWVINPNGRQASDREAKEATRGVSEVPFLTAPCFCKPPLPLTTAGPYSLCAVCTWLADSHGFLCAPGGVFVSAVPFHRLGNRGFADDIVRVTQLVFVAGT